MRLHDLNQSGWWALALYIIMFLAGQSLETDLIFSSGVFIFLSSIKGTIGDNKYGNDPLIDNQNTANFRSL
jgi:uncharacterized membrane protein YhaH (DUF805 family)